MSTYANAEHSHHECPLPDESGEGGPDPHRTLQWRCGSCGRVWAPDGSIVGGAYWTEVQGPQEPRGVIVMQEPKLPELEVGETMKMSSAERAAYVTSLVIAVIVGLTLFVWVVSR